MRIQSLSFDALTEQGVDPRFARILTHPEGYHRNLSILVGESDWDYFIPADAGDIVPLWDFNADSVVRWKRNDAIEYVLLYHDDPKWSLIAKFEQGVKAELWRRWIEFQEANDDECERFAEAIGFRQWREGLALLDRDFDAFMKWRLELADD